MTDDNPHTTECAACNTPLLGPDDTEGYCPDCAPDAISGHARRYVARQCEAQRELEAR